MANYRRYCLDGIGHITSVALIDAEDDGHAIIVAQSMKMAVGYEVWDRNRLVARIPATQAKA